VRDPSQSFRFNRSSSLGRMDGAASSHRLKNLGEGRTSGLVVYGVGDDLEDDLCWEAGEDERACFKFKVLKRGGAEAREDGCRRRRAVLGSR
jgi:hypothetical protein